MGMHHFKRLNHIRVHVRDDFGRWTPRDGEKPMTDSGELASWLVNMNDLLLVNISLVSWNLVSDLPVKLVFELGNDDAACAKLVQLSCRWSLVSGRTGIGRSARRRI